MNKVFNINLGGYPFTIDEDAYEHLSNYLSSIHQHFRASDGYEEITSDIETRLAELFQDSLGERPIVTLKDVKDTIVIMGTPEDFGAEPIEEPTHSDTTEETEASYKTGKRLFLNPDDEVVGGVCSGIAAYFGLQDPLWVRIAFILITLSGGLGIPAYIILWAILPKAETASDRLAMRGQPINVSNIGKIIEEEMGNLSNRVSELGDELNIHFRGTGTDKDKKKRPPQGASNLRDALAQSIAFLGRAIRALIELAARIIRPFLILLAIALVLGLAVAWIGSIIGIFYGTPFFNYLMPGPSHLTTTIGIANILIVIGVPLFTMALTVLRLVFKTRLNRHWKTGLWIFWTVNLISLIFLGNIIARDFTHGRTLVQDNLSTAAPPTLMIEAMENPYQDTWFQIGNTLAFTDNLLISREVKINVEQSESGLLEIIQENHARGRSPEQAEKLASNIIFKHYLDGNTLLLQPNFTIPKGEKWRNQNVQITIKVPVGTNLNFAPGIRSLIHHLQVDNEQEQPWNYYDCDSWTMLKSGLICPIEGNPTRTE